MGKVYVIFYNFLPLPFVWNWAVGERGARGRVSECATVSVCVCDRQRDKGDGLVLSDSDHFRKTLVEFWTIYYHLSSHKGRFSVVPGRVW